MLSDYHVFPDAEVFDNFCSSGKYRSGMLLCA